MERSDTHQLQLRALCAETSSGHVIPGHPPGTETYGIYPLPGTGNQLMVSVNPDAASFLPVRLAIAVVDEQDCVNGEAQRLGK